MHQDRAGLAVDELRLEPRTGVADPLRDFLASVGAWAGRPPRPQPFVEERGRWLAVEMNEWFRFDKPGKYHLWVIAHPVRNSFEAFGNREPGAITLTSNTIEFEIAPADPVWQAATLEKAIGLVETKFNSPRQQEGCRILRFLTTRAAVDEMIKHYADEGVCEAEYRDGLFAFPDREYAAKKMEDGILDPAVPVSAAYLHTLATLSAYLKHPEFLPDDGDQYLGKSEWLISGPLAANWNLIEAEENHYAEELVGALGDKAGQARALSLKAIFDSPLLGRPTLLESNDTALLDKLRKELAEVFTDLPVSEQSMLLYSRWANIASPAMIPVLRRLYENPPQGSNEQYVAVVLAHLNELAPSEGRALILSEMKRAHPRLDVRFVHLLPDKEIPELDEPLAENLEASNGQDSTIVELIGRYATPAIFPRVVAMEGDRVGQIPCEAQAALLAYAFRSDPGSGAEMLEKALAARKSTRCYTMTLGEVARRHMTPEIEQVAIAHLHDPDLEVAASAAATLRNYGSTAAEQPLWDRLQEWHSAWVGRAGELPNGFGSGLRNGLETSLEMALIEALGSGQAWFAGPEKLARLTSLCASHGGCQRVQDIIRQSSDAPIISVFLQAEGRYSASVSQYQVDSLDSLKQKLAQFPEGTAFKWAFGGDAKDGTPILAEIRQFLTEHGMTVR